MEDLERRVEETVKEKGLDPNSSRVKNIVAAGLMYDNGFGHGEICEYLRLSQNSVGSYLRIARKLNLVSSYRGSYRRKTKEERFDEIKRLIEAGITDRSEIAKRLCLTSNYVSQIVAKSLPEYKRWTPKSIDERVKEVKDLIDSGITNVGDIAKRMGLSKVYYIISQMPSQYQELCRSNKPLEERRKQIKGLIKTGVRDIEEIAKILGLEGVTIRNYNYRFKLDLPMKPVYSSNYKRRFEIDELISKGKSLPEIGNAFGLTKEGVRQYVNSTGQYRQWTKKRGEIRQEIRLEKDKKYRLCQELASLITARAYQVAAEKGWAYQKAVEYDLSRKTNSKTNILLDRLVNLFSSYKQAKDRGKKISLEKLAEKSGLGHATSVARVFKKAGVEPFYGNKDGHRGGV